MNCCKLELVGTKEHGQMLKRIHVLAGSGEGGAKEEGDVDREYKAKHGDNFLSSWLREDGETRWTMKLKKRKVSVKRTCVNLVSAEAFDTFSQEEVSESCEKFLG